MSSVATPTASGVSTPSPTHAVVAALDTLYQNPDNNAKAQANNFLQSFQSKAEAWESANTLLLEPTAPLEARLFAAQTFRSKIIYDLSQLPRSTLASLRDTLIAALETFSAGGARVVQTQLCLGISDLALQMHADEWADPVADMVAKFGQSEATVNVMLEFLTVLPEEVANYRIPVSAEEHRTRSEQLLSAKADEVLKLLSMYISAPGITQSLQNAVFHALRSWLNAGELTALSIAATPLFPLSFDALSQPSLFDAAVDVLCDLIHETQELDECVSVIQQIVPRLVALKPRLDEAARDEDSDSVRGYCRLFTEAGETYRPLVLAHPAEFGAIVEAIAACAAFPDLDIVPITFNFWYRLAQSLQKRSHADPNLAPFLAVYEQLVSVIIGHLRFPDDPGSMTGQERDDFRAFRHYMGDTLKDCCAVLGATSCMRRAYELVAGALSQGGKWQDLEAPLFSMRSMGSAIDPAESEVLPLVMDLVPNLPSHPRLRYAAILVISRYTEWIDHHPSYIPFLLSYISAGFSDAEQAEPDVDVSAAASQAMKFLCQDCNRHLVPYLPQLHSFVETVGPRLPREDLAAISEAIAHVISAMPPDEAAAALNQFVHPLVERIAAAVAKPEVLGKEELKNVAGLLEQIESFLAVVRSLGSSLPAACAKTPGDVWTVLDALLSKYGSTYSISERVSAVLRRGMVFFGDAAAPIVPAVLARMASSFEATGFSGYLWITGRCIGRYGRVQQPEVEHALRAALENVSAKVFVMLETTQPSDMPDVIEDYVHTLLQVVEYTPDLLFLSPIFPAAFSTAITALSLLSPELLLAALDLIREIVGHQSLSPSGLSAPSGASSNSAHAQAIRTVVGQPQNGARLVAALLQGLVAQFPEDCTSTVITLMRILADLFPEEMAQWVPLVVEQGNLANIAEVDQRAFVQAFNAAMAERSLDKVKQAMQQFYRASRKSRERASLALADR